MQNRLKYLLLTLIISFSLLPSLKATEVKRYNVGYFEAGQYDIHSILREEYFNQLEILLPESVQLVSVPEGFRSAEWNRDKSKRMAKQLTDVKHLDFIIAIGPWVIQDLLEAGFDKPIIGMHQFNPKAEGLLSDNDKPIAQNLTVHFRPGKTVDDIRTLMKLLPLKKLGLLYFPSDDTTHSMLKHIESLGKQFGFEVVTATEYDNIGTFAFHKSYNSIRNQKVDAIYLPPLWGLETQELSSFFEMLNREKVPTFTDEGSLILQHGATATNNYFGLVSEAYFNAIKTIDIINGAVPSELPVVFRGGYQIALNEKSAKDCNLNIRADLFNSNQIVDNKSKDEIAISSLSELVNKAVNQNPQILSHFDKIDIENSNIEISKSKFKPQVSSEIEFDYFDKNLRHNFQHQLDSKAFQASLNISQTLFSLEKMKEIQAAQKLKKITELTKLTEQLDLEHAVSLAYLDYLKIQEQNLVIQNLRNMVSYNLELLHAKLTIHNTDSLDYLRIENFRYKLTLAFIENHRMLKSAQIILNSLLNLPQDEPFVLDNAYFSETAFIDTEAPIISKFLTHNLQENIGQNLLEKMLSQNPQQSKSDALNSYFESILDKHKSAFYPEVQLNGSLLYDDFRATTDLFQEKRPSWYIGGKISFPLYLGGKRHKETNKAAAQLSNAEYQKDIVSLEIMKKGMTNFQKFVQYTEQMTPAYQAKKRAYSALQIANKSYNSETLSTTDFLEIIKSAYQADIQSIQIRYNYYASMSALVHSLGIPVSDSYSDFVNQFHSELGY